MENPLTENEKLLRGIWPNYIRSNGTIRSSAFKPRGNEGVSVDRVADRPLEEAIDFLLDKLGSTDSRVGSVTVGQCNEIPVTVQLEPTTSDPFHAGIYSEEKVPLDAIKYKMLADVAVLEK